MITAPGPLTAATVHDRPGAPSGTDPDRTTGERTTTMRTITTTPLAAHAADPAVADACRRARYWSAEADRAARDGRHGDAHAHRAAAAAARMTAERWANRIAAEVTA